MILATRHDLTRIMRIMLHPSVRPSIGEHEKTNDELAVVIGKTFDKFLYVLTDSRNGFFQIERMTNGSSDQMAHAAALPSCRGWEMFDAGRETIELLRAGGCDRIYAWATHDNRSARMYAMLLGFKPTAAPDNWRTDYYDTDEGSWMALEVNKCPVQQQA